MTIRARAALSAAAILAAASAQAREGPRVEWGVLAETAADWTFDADDEAAELIDLYPTLEAAAVLQAAPWLSFTGHAVLEPAAAPTGDRVFDDLGLYMDELFATADLGVAEVSLGKLGVPFGLAWDAAPGIYGPDFAEDYELAEQWGLVAAVPFGAHVLSGAVFFADTTFLSDSAATSRGVLKASAGGAGNTESPDNFALAISGPLAPDTAYTAGVRYLSSGESDPENELGLVLGVTHEHELIPDLGLGLMAEGAWLSNAGGGSEDTLHLTAGAALLRGPWELSAVYARRDTDGAPTDHLGTTTLAYAFNDALSAGVAYRLGREEGETSHAIGLVISYEIGGQF